MFWETIVSFFSDYGLHTLLGISVVGNAYLIFAWIRRERHLELTEIEVSLFKPRLKFELNKDEKYKFMTNEIIRLKNELDLIKKESGKPQIIIIFMIFIALLIGVFLVKKKKSEKSSQPQDDDAEKDQTKRIEEEVTPENFLEELKEELEQEKEIMKGKKDENS